MQQSPAVLPPTAPDAQPVWQAAVTTTRSEGIAMAATKAKTTKAKSKAKTAAKGKAKSAAKGKGKK